jgi:two-component system response regulator NreC
MTVVDPKKPITIVIAEDHHIVRHGLKLTLEAEHGMKILGEASDGLRAMELVEQLHPDILLTDLMLPQLHGLELTRRVKKQLPNTRVVILSMHADQPYVVEALRNGAAAFVLKDSTATDLVLAVREAMKGRRYLSPALAERAIAALEQLEPNPQLDIYDTLTQRERLVLQLAAEGKSAAEIGKRLFISQRTAETHRSNLMRKLGLRSQTDLVRFAIRKGIVPQ